MKIIKLTFDHKKEGLVYFKTESQDLISLPEKFIPCDFEIKKGTILYLTLQKNLFSEANQKQLARALLEEILNGGK